MAYRFLLSANVALSSFPGTILPPTDGCCIGPNNRTIALEGINPRKLYQQLLLTTPRVIGAAGKQANRCAF